MCAAWCNDWTPDFQHCQGCNSCSQDWDGRTLETFKDGNGVCVDFHELDHYQCWSRDDAAIEQAGYDGRVGTIQLLQDVSFMNGLHLHEVESHWNSCEEAYGAYPNISLTYNVATNLYYCDPSCDFVSRNYGRFPDDYLKVTRGGAQLGPNVCEAPQRVHDQTFCKAREARTGILCLDREDAGFDFLNDDCIEHEEYELYDCEAVNAEFIADLFFEDILERAFIGREPPPRSDLLDLISAVCGCRNPEEVGIMVTSGDLRNVSLTDLVAGLHLLHEECVNGVIHTSVHSTSDGCGAEPLVTFYEATTHDMGDVLCPERNSNDFDVLVSRNRKLSKAKANPAFLGLHLHTTPKRKRAMQKLLGKPNATQPVRA